MNNNLMSNGSRNDEEREQILKDFLLYLIKNNISFIPEYTTGSSLKMVNILFPQYDDLIVLMEYDSRVSQGFLGIGKKNDGCTFIKSFEQLINNFESKITRIAEEKGKTLL